MTEPIVLVPNPLMTIDKNAHCPCGSGYRFKLCHRPKLPCMVPQKLADDNESLLRQMARARAVKNLARR
jgi:uncharacterized protein YchJ